MRVEIKIDCDNAAFEDNMSQEVARILDTAKAHLKRMHAVMDDDYSVALRDINGNKVGFVRLTLDSAE